MRAKLASPLRPLPKQRPGGFLRQAQDSAPYTTDRKPDWSRHRTSESRLTARPFLLSSARQLSVCPCVFSYILLKVPLQISRRKVAPNSSFTSFHDCNIELPYKHTSVFPSQNPMRCKMCSSTSWCRSLARTPGSERSQELHQSETSDSLSSDKSLWLSLYECSFSLPSTEATFSLVRRVVKLSANLISTD